MLVYYHPLSHETDYPYYDLTYHCLTFTNYRGSYFPTISFLLAGFRLLDTESWLADHLFLLCIQVTTGNLGKFCLSNFLCVMTTMFLLFSILIDTYDTECVVYVCVSTRVRV